MQRTSTMPMNILTSDMFQKTSLNVPTQEARKNDLKKIKSLLKLGFEPEYPSSYNWFRLGGQTFNGFTKEQVEKMQKEVCDDDEQI